MDVKNLETASDYINNLLLSRGLLRTGEPISFAHPSQGEGGKQATIAKVINLVHDLILRRDRESDTLTRLSHDLSNARSTSILQTQTIAKLEARNADLERQLSLKATSEKAATTNLKTAEARNKALKDDLARLKATVTQIRAQCANDVRRKETEVKRLQKYLEPKRGREGSVQVGVTVVNPGASLHGSQGSRSITQPTLLDDTTEYLTQLGRDLSVENEALKSLARSTTASLRQLQGIPEPNQSGEEIYDGAISQTSQLPIQTLEADLKDVLNQLGSLLTNPSFVPLEEVEIREDEIVRLREGWEKMETRWREALSLMNGWRKRMMETGDAINLDDLRKGLILGSTPISMPPPTSTRKGRISASHLPSPDDSLVEDKSTSMSLDQQEESLRHAIQMNAELESPVPVSSEEKLGMGLFPAPKVLRPTTGNTQRIPRLRRRSIEQVNDSNDTMHRSPFKKPRLQETPLPELDDILLSTAYDSQVPLEAEAESEDDQELPLSIEEKLSQAKREAEEAAAALRKAAASPVRDASPRRGPTDAFDQAVKNRQANPEPAKPVKRTKVPVRIGPDGTKRSKRRSTLLPEELAGLMNARS